MTIVTDAGNQAHQDGRDIDAGCGLRDRFAIAALTSGLVREDYPEWQLKAWFGNRSGLHREEIAARAAYAYADAMEAERTKRLRARTDSTNGNG